MRLNFSPRSVFRHLIQVDPDAFWFTLNEVHCPWPYPPPHPDLPPVQLSGMGRQRDEFSDNVLKLLSEEFQLPVGLTNKAVIDPADSSVILSDCSLLEKEDDVTVWPRNSGRVCVN